MPRLTTLLFCAAALAAQQPRFEVASVKASPPSAGRRMGPDGGPGSRDPGLFTCRNCSLAVLLATAYDVRLDQISGPGWLESTKFDISAKVSPECTRDQFRLMQQKLIADRFQLTLHHETRQLPSYRLVVAKSGLKLKESDMPGATNLSMLNGNAHLQVAHETMERFAALISNQLGSPVLNATSLDGTYSFALDFAFDTMMSGPMGRAAADSPHALETDAGPTLFSALQSQLGLKLESKKGPVDILIIDHAEKVPTEN